MSFSTEDLFVECYDFKKETTYKKKVQKIFK